MKKKNLFMIMFLLIVLLLVGCTQPETEVDVPGDVQNESDDAEVVSDEESPPSEKRDTVRTSYVQQVTTADPHNNNGIIAHNQALWQTFEPLFRVNSKEVIPLLATNYDLSDDGLTYKFYLREDVKFHNGDTMTADDVVWSVNRALENPHYANKLAAFKEIRKVDDFTVEVETSYVNVYFFNEFNYICILSQRAVEEAGEDYGTKAIDSGTGPYRMTYFKGDERIEYEAFPDYYLGEPSIKKAIHTLVIDASTLFVSFQNGELDFTTIPESNWNEIAESGKYNLELAQTEHTTYILINNSRPPFDDKLVKQALNYAVDREEIVIMAYEGLADIAYIQANPEVVFGSSLEGIDIYDYNPEKARELLAEAGYPDGFDMTITCANIYFFEKIANIFQAELADIGINADIEIVEASAGRAKYVAGDFDVGVMGLNVENSIDFLYVYYEPEKGNKYMQVTDLYPSQLLLQARSELDEDKRMDIYQEFTEYTNENAFTIPLFYRYMPYAWDKDLNASITFGYFFYEDFNWN